MYRVVNALQSAHTFRVWVFFVNARYGGEDAKNDSAHAFAGLSGRVFVPGNAGTDCYTPPNSNADRGGAVLPDGIA